MKLRSGQVAVVTGAASGIGLAVTRSLGQAGTTVVMADVEDVALRRAAAAVADDGALVYPVVTDVSSWSSVQQLAELVAADIGPVDLPCNNAGVVGPWAPTWQQGLSNWRWVFGVNLDGVVHGLRAFLPAMVDRDFGRVVNVASRGGVTALPGNAVYAASKHAVVGLTETLREELSRIGSTVGVTLVLPGLVDTNIRSSDRNRPAVSEEDLMQASPDWRPQGGTPGVSAEGVALAIVDAVENDVPIIAPGAEELVGTTGLLR